MSLDERIAALRVYRWAEWNMAEPKWLLRIKVDIYNEILLGVYMPAIARALTEETALMRRLHQ